METNFLSKKRLVALALASLPLVALGQMTIGGQALLCLGDASALCLTGDLSNQGQVQDLGGTLQLHGDLLNQGRFESQGHLELVSGQEQVLDPRQASLRDLRIKGGGAKRMLSGASLSGILLLEDGILLAPAQGQLLLEESASAEGASTASHVQGWLFARAPEALLPWPIGDQGEFLPAQVIAAHGFQPVVGLKAYAQNPYPTQTGQLDWVGAQAWEWMDLSGTTDSLHLQIAGAEPFGEYALEDVVVARFSEESSTFESLGGQDAAVLDGLLQARNQRGALPGILALAQSTARPRAELFIPNALWPQAPNPEDRVIKCYGDFFDPAEPFLFRVVDAWSKEVFRSTDAERMAREGWDGSRGGTGELLPAGNYRFFLEGVSVLGEPYLETGTINLLR